MNETASYKNIHFSIEKFLFPVAQLHTNDLLICEEDIDIRLGELEDNGKAVVWRVGEGSAANHGKIKLHVGATTFQDPGGITRLTIYDSLKELFDVNGSIPVHRYDATNQAQEIVNQLAIIGDVKILPSVLESNGFKTKLLQVQLYFGQKRI